MTLRSLRRFRLFLMLLLCLSAAARAQSGGASVTVSGSVSGVVALSSPPWAGVPAGGVRVTSSQNPDRSLTITLSGNTCDITKVSIPIQIRSNIAYRLFAKAKADGSDLSSLSVVDARPSGNLVAADAVGAISVAGMFDASPGTGKLTSDDGFNHPSFSSPVELLSGPRVSLGGTLVSPQNALEVTLSVEVEPRVGNQPWAIELLLTAEPAARL